LLVHGKIAVFCVLSLNPATSLKKFILFWLLFSFFYSTGAWTQGLHLEPLHQHFYVKNVFQSLVNYLPGLALNLDPTDLCLLSS
jgi:hypothetical protein